MRLFLVNVSLTHSSMTIHTSYKNFFNLFKFIELKLNKKGIEIMKVMKVMPTEKVVEFSQSEFKTKLFRHDYPVSSEVNKMMEELHKEFLIYAEQYFTESALILQEFIEEHHLRKEKILALEYNLYWWKILYDSSKDIELSCVENFIAESYLWFRDKPLITSWLREWDLAVPKFYFVGHKYSDNVFLVIDILEDKIIDVIVRDPIVQPPKQGEIVMGTLIPFGDSIYSPIGDFYRFDYEAREEIAGNLKHYYNQHLKTSSMHEAFLYVLSATLQIEHFVYKKKSK
jgi:hypothetical protein